MWLPVRSTNPFWRRCDSFRVKVRVCRSLGDRRQNSVKPVSETAPFGQLRNGQLTWGYWATCHQGGASLARPYRLDYAALSSSASGSTNSAIGWRFPLRDPG
jgi:hypothetical protein